MLTFTEHNELKQLRVDNQRLERKVKQLASKNKKLKADKVKTSDIAKNMITLCKSYSPRNSDNIRLIAALTGLAESSVRDLWYK